MNKKTIQFLGSSRKVIDKFPKEVQHLVFIELESLQEGKNPFDWKTMSSVGLGVCQIHIHRPFGHRIIYVAKFSEAIYVLHAFAKKSQKTPRRHIQQAKQEYEKIKEIRKRSSLHDSFQ
ncbi:MAG: type II toxin-antitoxin system RelE/ParE family toxin [Candidatus Melainabacteria bacterium]|nr:MAG: type II toxin-antitoxin system RelE/ParE family toxin [Candidatus Melainabacteria bacterium]